MARLPDASSEGVPTAGIGQNQPAPGTSARVSELAARGTDRTAVSVRRGTISRAALQSGQRWRRTVRWLGLGIFVVGAGLLAYVFLQALHGFQQFTQPDYLSMRLNRVAGDTIPSQIQAAVAVFGAELLRVLYLLLLGYIASVIAAKGIQFFAASDSIIDEAVVSSLEDDMDVAG
ncbi:MAG: hypothetical protein JO316_03840 [Abitibacteriaceae bacterium]|nr:hypothetical protein [Abditibacteriaceae bacterium]